MPKTRASKKPKECPRCGQESLRTVWTNGRKLKQECVSGHAGYEGSYCEWEGKPFTPDKRPIRTVKTVSTDDHGGWQYTAYDQYGHTAVMSESFNTRAKCEKEAQKDIDGMSKDPHYGRCSAVIWPPTVKVRGHLLRATVKRGK